VQSPGDQDDADSVPELVMSDNENNVTRGIREIRRQGDIARNRDRSIFGSDNFTKLKQIHNASRTTQQYSDFYDLPVTGDDWIDENPITRPERNWRSIHQEPHRVRDCPLHENFGKVKCYTSFVAGKTVLVPGGTAETEEIWLSYGQLVKTNKNVFIRFKIYLQTLMMSARHSQSARALGAAPGSQNDLNMKHLKETITKIRETMTELVQILDRRHHPQGIGIPTMRHLTLIKDMKDLGYEFPVREN
jgi:hypothetical protein